MDSLRCTLTGEFCAECTACKKCTVLAKIKMATYQLVSSKTFQPFTFLNFKSFTRLCVEFDLIFQTLGVERPWEIINHLVRYLLFINYTTPLEFPFKPSREEMLRITKQTNLKDLWQQPLLLFLEQ